MLKVLSLFSGGGGMDIGMEGGFICHRKSLPKDAASIKIENMGGDWVRVRPTRFYTCFANDIVPQAGIVWQRYMQQHATNPPRHYHLGSIVDLVQMARQGQSVFPSNIDLITGGFPCQDFSVAGARRGFQSNVTHHGTKINPSEPSEQNRGQLYYWMKQVIDIVKPKMFIAENVKGLVSLGNVKDIIQADFAQAGDGGYLVLTPQILQAADYGVPQTRERIIFIGLKKSALRKEALEALQQEAIPAEYNPYPNPSHAFTTNDPYLQEPVTCYDVLKHLQEPTDSHDPAQQCYSKAKYLGPGHQGQSEIPLYGQATTIRSEHHGNIEYRRLAALRGGQNTLELSKGLPERRLTPRECALIQTFPPDYEIVIKQPGNPKGKVSYSMAYKIIGNAVPPILAYSLARRIDQLWDSLFLL